MSSQSLAPATAHGRVPAEDVHGFRADRGGVWSRDDDYRDTVSTVFRGHGHAGLSAAGHAGHGHGHGAGPERHHGDGQHYPSPQYPLATPRRVRTHHITVSSMNRDISLFASASEFEVIFNRGRGFRNVTSISLLSATIPIVSDDTVLYPDLPPGTQLPPWIALKAQTTRGQDLDTMMGVSAPRRDGAPDNVETNNPITDSDTFALIPLEVGLTSTVEIAAVAHPYNVVSWKPRNGRPVEKIFNPPQETVNGLHLHLAMWGQPTSPRTQFDTYPLPDEAVPVVPVGQDPNTVASGMTWWRNCTYEFEVNVIE